MKRAKYSVVKNVERGVFEVDLADGTHIEDEDLAGLSTKVADHTKSDAFGLMVPR